MIKFHGSIAVSALLAITMGATAEHHEGEDLGMALLATYGYAPGGAPADLEAGMVTYQQAQEEAGFDDCGLYRHEFGDTRGVYTYCYFQDMQQFAKIADASPSEAVTEPQAFSSHTDHIVTVTKRNMSKAPPFVVFSRYQYDPSLSYNQSVHYGMKVFDMYDKAFGGCNAYAHTWGPELGLYISCGFENYADLAAKNDKLAESIMAEMGNEPMFLLQHSDDILRRVMD